MLKKLSILMITGILVACSGLDNLSERKHSGPIKEIKGELEIPKEKKIEDNDTKIISKEISDENIREYLSIIKNNLKNSIKKVDDNIKNDYTIDLGETLIFPLDNEKALKLMSSPKNTNARINISNGKVNFRSIYQGQYILSTYMDNTLNRKINIAVKAKYNFSEKEVYDIIVRNSENKNKDLENAVTLYKMMFPTGRYLREVNYLFLKYAYDIRNVSIMNEALSGLKNDFSWYSDEEKAVILKVAKLTNKNVFVPAETYNTTNPKLKKALHEYLGNKENFDKNDKLFMEKIKLENSELSNEVVKEKLKELIDSSVPIRSKSLLDIKTKNKIESYYDKAMKNLNSNPRVAIENFKKSLSTEKIQDKKSEIYYNIASSYAKLGNKVEVTKYLRLLKQEFPNSEWLRKSEALTKLIN